MDLSAVFIVPIIYRFKGTINFSPEGKVAVNGIAPPKRLSFSIKVISSPNTLEIFALFISSINIQNVGFRILKITA